MREFLLALVLVAAIGGVFYYFNQNQVHVLTNSIMALVLD